MNDLSQKYRDDAYPFSTEIPVRITDINYGNHLGHVASVGIFHQARVLFLKSHGINEMDVEGLGVIQLASSYLFKNEAHFNDMLNVYVAMGDYSKLKFNFLYRAINTNSGREIVSGNEELAFFNYSKRKVTRIPQSFLKLCAENQLKTS